jgi:c-di-GMP-binding flagellar brake protein YcgR
VLPLLERRAYLRLRRNLRTKVEIIRTSTKIEGITEDLSQGGAFISSPSWSSFEDNDQTTMSLFLPPEMTGQPETLILSGPAVVRRIETAREGVAFQFLKELKTFNVSY